MYKIVFLISLVINFIAFSSVAGAENWKEFTFFKTNSSWYASTVYFDKDSTYFDGEKIVTRIKSVDAHAPGAESIINAYFVHDPVKVKNKPTQYLYRLYFADKTDYYNGKYMAAQKYKDPLVGNIFEPELRDFIEIVQYAGFDPTSIDEQYKPLKSS